MRTSQQASRQMREESRHVVESTGRTVFRVGVMGASLHSGNRGVAALGASLVGLMCQTRPNSQVSLLIGHREAKRTEVRVEGGCTTVRTVNYRLSPRAPLKEQLWWIMLMSALYQTLPSATARRLIIRRSPWIRAIAEADLVGDIRGGDSFSDIYGLSNFLLGCLPVLSVIWIRRGIHLFPQTYGPFRSKLAERLARYILSRADSIWCRDRLSLAEVSRLTDGSREGMLCPDVAFSLAATRPERPAIDPPLRRDGSTVVGINVSGLVYNGGYTRANMFRLRLDYRVFLKRLVEQLLLDNANRILLVPHTFASPERVESDPAACLEVLRQVSPELRDRVHLVTEEYDQHEIKGVIGMCDVFIGSRMHACIGALSQGIPTVGVAYSRKFVGVFETVGAGHWVIDARDVCVQEALDRVGHLLLTRDDERARLQGSVATARAELRRSFDWIAANSGRHARSGGRSAPSS